jgi:hypothetical protein
VVPGYDAKRVWSSPYTKLWSVCCLVIWLFKLVVNNVVDAYSLLSRVVILV